MDKRDFLSYLQKYVLKLDSDHPGSIDVHLVWRTPAPRKQTDSSRGTPSIITPTGRPQASTLTR